MQSPWRAGHGTGCVSAVWAGPLGMRWDRLTSTDEAGQAHARRVGVWAEAVVLCRLAKQIAPPIFGSKGILLPGRQTNRIGLAFAWASSMDSEGRPAVVSLIFASPNIATGACNEPHRVLASSTWSGRGRTASADPNGRFVRKDRRAAQAFVAETDRLSSEGNLDADTLFNNRMSWGCGGLRPETN